ncbi:hypothetical protein SAV14893_040390 [Streptomyces avermitilis]|uniref:Uncharacterized protein n=1 Tax=Streptomyces avermitilis TaxID=33903 RepID=A0A4D4MSQ2_STRAX|nr:hypothetical protein SAVMC3_52390 [Streptomyces avermitilis]GDY64646.1 hypothetical protein SAV14893_040390 [Streptomyces avermitilis]GDY75171.1 hypothetical protein SAV31267_046560 [Streptomyces avermitilis]GDY84186.1 hypothetical protein SAVCW2_33850 [Streptomyces avermitilis]
MKCSHSAAMLTGEPSDRERLYAATLTVTALPRRCARARGAAQREADTQDDPRPGYTCDVA